MYGQIAMRSPLGSRAVDHVVQVMAFNPGKPFFMRELARLAGEPVNGVSQAIRRLTADGLVRQLDVGGRRAFTMDRSNPFFEEIQRLALKSLDLPGRLDEAGVTAVRVLVYGSFASGTADEGSDLDVLVVGREAHPGAAQAAMERVSRVIGRDVSVVVATHRAFREAEAGGAGFLATVLASPMIVLRDGT